MGSMLTSVHHCESAMHADDLFKSPEVQMFESPEVQMSRGMACMSPLGQPLPPQQ